MQDIKLFNLNTQDEIEISDLEEDIYVIDPKDMSLLEVSVSTGELELEMSTKYEARHKFSRVSAYEIFDKNKNVIVEDLEDFEFIGLSLEGDVVGISLSTSEIQIEEIPNLSAFPIVKEADK